MRTLKSFKFLHPGDIMCSQNPYPGDRPHNQIPVGGSTTPTGLTLIGALKQMVRGVNAHHRGKYYLISWPGPKIEHLVNHAMEPTKTNQ